MPQFKTGVVMWGMHRAIEDNIHVIDAVSRIVVSRDALITAARDGKHSDTSLHYQGRAIDLRIKDIPRERWEPYRANLAVRLGLDFDVVLEPNHIHLEYDP